ncbi:ClpP family protease [Pseudactinotalea sp.]|uniref:ClpP family protease n=1 Tax=Pseudactinotalea sp. TaxID=1926260 RepID=UPI003B3A0BAD
MSSYTIPSVVETTSQGQRASDVYSRLLSDRIVFLGTEIDDGVANTIIAQLIHLESADPDREISLYLNSPGGSVTASLAIYDTMQFVRAPVSTICVGQAASTAAMLLAAGEPGRRGMLPHARVLLHPPETGGRGTLPDLRLAAKEVARTREQLEEILAQHTGRSVEQVREEVSRDLVLPAEQARAYGVVDEVIASRKLLPAA